MSKIIAVIGMPGSGKSEAIQYLEQNYKLPKVYFGQITLDEVKRRGLELTPNNERIVRESLRDEFGESYYAQEIIKKIETMKDKPLIVADGLYSWVEYQMFRATFGKDFVTVAIHASPSMRHDRLGSRPRRPLTQSEAMERDIAELNRFEKGSPIALSDFMIVNEGTREELQGALDKVIASFHQVMR